MSTFARDNDPDRLRDDDYYWLLQDDDYRSWLTHRQITMGDYRFGGAHRGRMRDVAIKAKAAAIALMKRTIGAITAAKMWRVERELMFRGMRYERLRRQGLLLDRQRLPTVLKK